MNEAEEQLRDLLKRELRAAIAAKLERRAAPGEITADLLGRLRRLQDML
jgi:hypothetical protein